ncbi:site-specific integrase [Pectobacterium polaris]|uniref:site-specific integrase n=1 Tax=Pectobacterium polaris TaxID=2042057 RepID=UPI0020C6F1BE|nr:site-specific integrase [Pectobacterium polaris]
MINEINHEEECECIAINSGYVFLLREPLWSLDKNIKLSVWLVLNKLHISHHQYFLKTLSYFAMTTSSSYTKKMFWAFYDFVKCSEDGLITERNIRKFYSKVINNNIDYLDSIRVFFRKWVDSGYLGVTEEHVNFLYKGKIKRRRIGEMVNTMDIRKGPLIENDIINFNEGAMELYGKNEITLAELTMALITSYTGRRPIQTSHLKLKDVLSLCSDDRGEMALNYPRAKHGGTFRSEFTKLKIVEDLNDLIVILIEENISLIENVLRRSMTNKEVSEVPLFIDLNSLDEVKTSRNFYSILLTDFLHVKAELITRKIKKITKKLDSLQHVEVINARRFRYALGTRAAQEGYGEYIIAELLDHRSIRSVGCYVKNIPEHADKIDEVMTKSILNYVQAFKGELVLADTGGIKIKSHKGISSGNCSNCSDCNAPVPISCYTCPYFKPWIDAPHQEIYDFLLKERERVLEITGDIKVATALDRTIGAVYEVINKCNLIIRGRNDECN